MCSSQLHGNCDAQLVLSHLKSKACWIRVTTLHIPNEQMNGNYGSQRRNKKPGFSKTNRRNSLPALTRKYYRSVGREGKNNNFMNSIPAKQIVQKDFPVNFLMYPCNYSPQKNVSPPRKAKPLSENIRFYSSPLQL